ncbi:protein croquemort [Nomia melanderi]|uniref:protein croquemort n=1 Tax=Nomia melanderi TaxID=2448451 RepID=UPI00130428F4|nr:protein croquemort-like [Nomia melanderi]XP_031845638.1 protein croquemort-like [Nomia melanderi]XP_031845639.1 protein croquemort-like [Nomia melanderi]
MFHMSKITIVILLLGLIIAIFGLALGIVWSTIYSTLVRTQLSLTPTSSNYDLWKETPIPMYLKLYMFNLTNPQALTSSDGTKPNFKEMGPYVFREIDYKVEQTWNDENNTITYQRKRVWHFDESSSKGSLSDQVTNINPIAASVAYTLRDKGPIFRDIGDRVMRILGEHLVITKSVNELLFEGYKDEMLILVRAANLTKIPMDKFAWFYGRNGTASYDGTFNMDTGASNILDLGIVREWNFKDNVNYYDGDCGKVKGTNGDLWPPLPDNETVTFFISDICTSLSVKLSNKTTVHEGLQGVTYTNDENIFDNGTKLESRKCYYQRGKSIPSGAMNISSCKWDAPAFISLPHFYTADPSYTEGITGMNPSEKNHQLTLSLEPETGVPLKISANLQLNLLIEPDPYMRLFKNISRTFVPMLWFTQEATLSPEYASTVKFIIILKTLGAVTFFGISFIGFIIMFTGVFIVIRNNMKDEENESLLARPSNGSVVAAPSPAAQ